MAGADFSGGVRTDSLTATGAVAGASVAISGAAAVGSLTVGGEAVSGGGGGSSKYIANAEFAEVKSNNSSVLVVSGIMEECTLTGAKVTFQTPPSSALGTVVIALSNYDSSETASVNLLAAASQDVEVAVAKTGLTLALTETAADLILEEGDLVEATVTSDNSDMSGGNKCVITLMLEPTS
jgi:hypothetical protein